MRMAFCSCWPRKRQRDTVWRSRWIGRSVEGQRAASSKGVVKMTATTTLSLNGNRPPHVTIVVAQCVQRSFLSPLPGPDPRLKPCHLHAGYVNAIRLLGGGPQNLPNVLEDFLWHAHGGEEGTVPGSEYVHVIYVDDEHYDDGSELTEQH